MQPDGYLVRVRPNTSGEYVYSPQSAGTYAVRYYCMDEAGNGALAEISLVVS